MKTKEKEEFARQLRSSTAWEDSTKAAFRASALTTSSQTQSESNTSSAPGSGTEGGGSGTDEDRRSQSADPPQLGAHVPHRPRRGGRKKQFPQRLYTMLNESDWQGNSNIVSWNQDGRSFSVRDQDQLVSRVLPRYTGQSKWTSFQRQLNLYGFQRITVGPDRGGYYHESFHRDRPDLVPLIERTRAATRRAQSSASESDQQEPSFRQHQAHGERSSEQAALPTGASEFQWGVSAFAQVEATASAFPSPATDPFYSQIGVDQPYPGMLYPMAPMSGAPSNVPMWQNMYLPLHQIQQQAAPPMMHPCQDQSRDSFAMLPQEPHGQLASLHHQQQPMASQGWPKTPTVAAAKAKRGPKHASSGGGSESDDSRLSDLTPLPVTLPQGRRPSYSMAPSIAGVGPSTPLARAAGRAKPKSGFGNEEGSEDLLDISALGDKDLLPLPKNDSEWTQLVKAKPKKDESS